jgi:histone acetyltransferase (RNA polymerase elongator complex component)
MYLKGDYSPLSIEEAVNRSMLLAKICIENNIKVIRIGLHFSDTLARNTIAGPLHPMFGSLVWNKIK